MAMATLNNWPWRCWAQRHPQAIAIDAGGQTLCWQQLDHEIAQLAAGFRQQGVEPGMVVALRSRNSLQAVLAWLSLLACGARVLTLNPQIPAGQLAPLLAETTPAFALSLDAPPCPPVSALRLCHSHGRVRQPWQPAALATLTLTSGTTGPAKAVAHSVDAHLRSAGAVTAMMDFTPRDRWLLSLPLFHVSGSGILWRWLYRGATLVVAEPGSLADGLARSSFASLVPTQLWRLLREERLPPGLRAVLLGGAAIPPALTRRAEAAGIRCWCGYGLTESASTVCAMRADGRGRVGLPLPGQEVKLVDNEVWLRSLTLARGYWRQGRLVPLLDDDGWLHTGDLGHWQQGMLCLDGRRDNLFFCGGEPVQPEQVEQVLQAHPAVTQAVVLARPDAEFGQRPVALVAGDIAFSDLASWAGAQLSPWQRPVAWYPMPATSGSGIKPSRPHLTAWLRAQK